MHVITSRRWYRKVLALAAVLAGLAAGAQAASAAAPNDDFSAAQVLTGAEAEVPGSNLGATGELGEPNHASASLPLASVWYAWTAPRSARTTFHTCHSPSFNTTLAVYLGSSLDALTEVVGNDDACGTGSTVRFNAVAGRTYWIAVDGQGVDEGSFTLRLEQGAPANDSFAAATVIPPELGSTSIAGSNRNATGEPGEPDHFYGDTAPTASVWYRWTPAQDADISVDTCDSDFDTVLALYSGTSLDDLTPLAQNDDGCRGGLGSSLIATARSGVTYWIAVEGLSSSEGRFTLAFEAGPPDRTPPRVGLSIATKRLSSAIEKGVRMRVSASEHARVCVVVRISLRRARALGLRPSRRDRRAGGVALTGSCPYFREAGERAMRLRFSSAGAGAMKKLLRSRRAARLSVHIEATDRRSNTRKVRHPLVLRP
jgi:hypothetical protein